MRSHLHIPAALFVLACVSPTRCVSEAPAAPSAARIAKSVKTIRNDFLIVMFDEAHGDLTLQTSSGKSFVTNGRFGTRAGGTAKTTAVTDKAFGKGRAIEVDYPDGNRDQILLFPDLPFALFRSGLHNSRREPMLVNHVRPLSGVVDLAKPAARLRSLGTGGLCEPDKNPGSYMWLAVADPQSRNGVVAGWLTGERGSGVVFTHVDQDRVHLDAQIDYGRLRLPAGATETLETFAVGYFEDARLGLESWADAVAKRYAIQLPPQPTGYCTWYHAGASDEKKLAEQTRFAAKHLGPFGLSFIQIDDGWQEGIKKNGPRKNFTRHRANGPYPSGMKAAAEQIKAQGLMPGIWFMPFAGTFDDPWFKDHQDWFIIRTDGTPFDVKWGGTSLDMTHRGAQAYVRSIVHQMAHEWGYRYFKMDGLWTGSGSEMQYVNDGYNEDHIGNALFHNPDKPNIEVLRDGLRLVRETAGRDVFLLGCCAPQSMRSYGGAFGLLDAMRIGPDNKAQWPSLLRGPDYGTRNYHLHGRIWYNDPDPLYARASLPLNEAQLICSWVTISGQLSVSSDAYADLPPERLDLLKRTMPAHGLRPRPVDLFEERLPRIWLLTDTRHRPRRDVIGLFNWSDNEVHLEYALDRLGLSGRTRYAVFDYWSNTLLPPLKNRLQHALPPHSCAVWAVRAVADHPQLLSTSRHITQGIVDVVEEKWDAATTALRGKSRLVENDPYELRIVTNSSREGWIVKDFEVSTADKDAGVRASVKQEQGLVRGRIESPISREVSWTVRFERSGKK